MSTKTTQKQKRARLSATTQLVEAIKITTDLNILDQVVWHGKQPNDVVQKKNERSSIIFIHKHK